MLGDMTVSQRHTRKRNLGSERLALFGDSEAVLIELALVDRLIFVIVDVGFRVRFILPISVAVRVCRFWLFLYRADTPSGNLARGSQYGQSSPCSPTIAPGTPFPVRQVDLAKHAQRNEPFHVRVRNHHLIFKVRAVVTQHQLVTIGVLDQVPAVKVAQIQVELARYFVHQVVRVLLWPLSRVGRTQVAAVRPR